MELVKRPPAEPYPGPADEEARLIRLLSLHEMPVSSTLNSEQWAGTRCMWCAAGAPDALRPLEGMSPSWPPRACTGCIEARKVKLSTYLAWWWHLGGCEECQRTGRCAAAEPLAQAHAAAVEAATGSRLVTCIRCQAKEDASTPHLTPLAWLGDASSHHSYAHIPKCRARRSERGTLRLIPVPPGLDSEAEAAAVPDDHFDWPAHGRPLRPEQWEPAGRWLKARYEGGASIRQLAEEIGRSYGFVHRYLMLAETTIRSHGGSSAKAVPGSDGADETTARTPGGRKPPTQRLKEEG
ncbi:helix-turn-helix domain-containing protein [Streptomyces murinus]